MIPRLLVLDDLFGRNVRDGRNPDRESLCSHFLWQDVTNDSAAKASRQRIRVPTAEVVFFRAQTPLCAAVGDTVVNNLALAIEKVREGWVGSSSKSMSIDARPWSLVLVDLCFYTGRVTAESDRRTPGMPSGCSEDDDPNLYFGLTLLDAIHREFPELPVMILSSKPRSEVSLQFSERGALGFIDRMDIDAPRVLTEAIWNHGLLPDSSENVVGRSLPLLLALRDARRASQHQQNVLIRGERGAGKELMAQYLNHFSWPTAKPRPFVAINSAIFTSPLFSSELFGIENRTATGVEGKIGLIESAESGDLFLDEIADMPTQVQASLLRVLQDHQLMRIGGRKSRRLEVRFLSATNANLEDIEREFRPDLLDRLRLGGTIWLPPLRDRPNDIPLLVERFVREAEGRFAGIRHRDVTPDAMNALMAHQWPGNIRELRIVIHDVVSRFPDVEHIVLSHLRFAPDRDPAPSQSHSDVSHERPDVLHQCIFEDLLNQLNHIDFGSLGVHAWAGKLAVVQLTQVRQTAKLLLASIEATKRRTPEHPSGYIQIHPALKLLTGSKTLTASKAADLVKRLLVPIEGELEGDLAEAYQIALRLRPKIIRTKQSG